MDPNHNATIQLDPEKVRAVAKRGCGCGVFMLLVVLVLSALGPYTEYLWFKHDIGHPEVMTVGYGAQGTLFVIGFVVSLAIFYLSLRSTLKQSMIYFDRPISFGQKIITNAMDWVQSRGSTAAKVASVIFGVVSGAGLAGEWQTMLLSSNGGKFGKNDPLLGIDIGFYVFQLPWYRAVVNFAFGVLLTTTIATIAMYVIFQALASLAKIELGAPKIRIHISSLVAALAIVFGFQSWLKTFEFGTMAGTQFTGAGFSAMSELMGLKVVAVASWILAIVVLATIRSKIPYRGAIFGAVALGATYLLGVIIVPSVIQRLSVEPDKINKEMPYAKHSIEMTRYAFQLDKIEVEDFTVSDAPTKDEVQAAQSTLGNMRLWSPDVLRDAAEQSQSFRPYYSFNDVDVDRYMIDGKQSLMMISPRDIRIDKLDPSARSWVNMRLQYTHGYGAIATPVNSATTSGAPNFMMKDIPLNAPKDMQVSEPRIYFSDFRDQAGEDHDEYALVDTKVDEFDYIVGDKTVSNRWTGKRGIPISGLIAKLAFAIRLGDTNLLISGNINSTSRLLIRRSVLERASHVLPFLRFDTDPYLVIHEGKLVWILDGYTTSDMVPYSDRIGEEGSSLNYIRNSVKVVIGAYDGNLNAYAIDTEDPILKAFRKIYPNLVQDFSKFPAGLAAHLRYPEDQLRLQAIALRQYHVTDPVSFLNNSDAWDIPLQRYLTNQSSEMRPYYVLMRLPNEPKDGFMQILPFTPRKKGNLAGWLAAHCDGEDLGRVVMYRFTRGSLIPGPELMESQFNQNEVISNINRQLHNEQSDIVVGNLLVIPIGKSVMYVEPLFLQGKNLQAIPELRKVILATKDKIVVGDTYQDALQKLFGVGGGAPATEPDKPQPTGTGSEPTPELGPVRQALGLLDKADQALRNGDFAKYGELQKQARELLKKVAGARSLPQ